jgi:hypothetical protein
MMRLNYHYQSDLNTAATASMKTGGWIISNVSGQPPHGTGTQRYDRLMKAWKSYIKAARWQPMSPPRTSL